MSKRDVLVEELKMVQLVSITILCRVTRREGLKKVVTAVKIRYIREIERKHWWTGIVRRGKTSCHTYQEHAGHMFVGVTVCSA